MVNGFYRTGTSFLANACFLKFPDVYTSHSHDRFQIKDKISLVPVREPLATISSNMAFNTSVDSYSFEDICNKYIETYDFYLANKSEIFLIDFRKIIINVNEELEKLKLPYKSLEITNELVEKEASLNIKHIKYDHQMMDRATIPRNPSAIRIEADKLVESNKNSELIKSAQESYLNLIEQTS